MLTQYQDFFFDFFLGNLRNLLPFPIYIEYGRNKKSNTIMRKTDSKPLKNFPKARKRMILEVDNPQIGKDLYNHVKSIGQFYSDEPEYFIWEVTEDYMVMYSRKSHSLHCYYQGYGHHGIIASISKFRTLNDVLGHIAKCADM